MTVEKLRIACLQARELDPRILERLRIEATYEAMNKSYEQDMVMYRREQHMALPQDINYRGLTFLSNEARERLDRLRPRSIADVKLMEGITPDAVIRLLRFVKNRSNSEDIIEEMP